MTSLLGGRCPNIFNKQHIESNFTYKDSEGVEVEVGLALALGLVLRPDDRQHPQHLGQEDHWSG